MSLSATLTTARAPATTAPTAVGDSACATSVTSAQESTTVVFEELCPAAPSTSNAPTPPAGAATVPSASLAAGSGFSSAGSSSTGLSSAAPASAREFEAAGRSYAAAAAPRGTFHSRPAPAESRPLVVRVVGPPEAAFGAKLAASLASCRPSVVQLFRRRFPTDKVPGVLEILCTSRDAAANLCRTIQHDLGEQHASHLERLTVSVTVAGMELGQPDDHLLLALGEFGEITGPIMQVLLMRFPYTTRRFNMSLSRPIPRALLVGGVRCTVTYAGQPMPCMACGALHRTSECPNVRCHRCRKQGHFSSACPTAGCRHCGERGHSETVCPTVRGAEIEARKAEIAAQQKSQASSTRVESQAPSQRVTTTETYAPSSVPSSAPEVLPSTQRQRTLSSSSSSSEPTPGSGVDEVTSGDEGVEAASGSARDERALVRSLKKRLTAMRHTETATANEDNWPLLQSSAPQSPTLSSAGSSSRSPQRRVSPTAPRPSSGERGGGCGT
mgnify:CR=1 FL=1